jgi:hypothetical protein
MPAYHTELNICNLKCNCLFLLALSEVRLLCKQAPGDGPSEASRGLQAERASEK